MDGQFIRLLRRRLGLTQFALAEVLDVDQGTISRWERGVGAPRPAALSAMRSLLLKDGEQRLRDRSFTLVRNNLVVGTIMDAKAILREGSKLADAHYHERCGFGLGKILGRSFERHSEQMGMPELWMHLQSSRFLEGEALLFRFVVNLKGIGHATIWEPVYEDGEVIAALAMRTHELVFPENDEHSLELVDFIPTDAPDTRVELQRGEHADWIEPHITTHRE